MILLFLSFLFALSDCQNSYNFPMEVGDMNVIYLKEYLPTDLQAPNYQISSQNDYNLTIEQSILLLNQQTFPTYLQIRCGSNYILDYGTNTNFFWFLTIRNDLYSGLILEDGSIEINLTTVQVQNLTCFNMNLLQINYGILTCYQHKSFLLTFLLVNSTSSETQALNTNQEIDLYLGDFTTSITQQNGRYNIILTNFNDTNVMVYNYSLVENNLTFFGQLNFDGYYTQALVSEQQNYLFLLRTEAIDVINLNTGINSALSFGDFQLQNIAVYQFSENIFQIALYQSSLIITFLYDFKYNQKHLHFQSKALTDSSTLLYLSVQPLKIFIVTDQYIAQLLIEELDSPIIEHYINLFPINYALINENRQIAIIFLNDQEASLYTISSYYFNEPNIQISSSLSLQIQQQFINNYQIQFTVTSGITSQQETIILNLIPVNQTNSTCPITFKNQYEHITLEYPDELIIPYSDVFIGPNITRTLYVSQANIIYGTQSNKITYYPETSTGFTYSIICADFHKTPIYCAQSQNKTLYIQQYGLVTQSYFINSSLTLQHCQCYNNEESLVVLFQFSNSILIQYFDIMMQPTNQLQFQYNQSILSSYLFTNQMFLIFQDGSLEAYNPTDNNQTMLFQIQGYGLQKIYTNEIAYPNYLFLDNSTNLLILYYKNENSYQIINQIPYPKTSYNYSSFGILRNGIFLSILDQTTPPYSFLYYYPKQYIFYSQTETSYFEFNMMGFNYFGNPILSGYSSQRYYVVLKNSTNACCFHTILKGSGTPFTVFEFQNVPSSKLKQLSVLQSIVAGEDLIQGLTSSGLIQLATMNSGYYFIYSYFNETNMNNVTQYYSAQNPGCQEIIIPQNITVVQNKSFLTPKNYDSELQNLEVSTNSTFQIQAQQLFYGNIENYDVTCDQCKSLSYSTPTSNSSFITVNITYQAASQQGDTLYIQDNQSLYYIANNSQLIKVYDFPIQYPTCNSLFFDMLSNLPISICSNQATTSFFSFNASSQEIIANSSLNVSNFFKSDYKNGIIQIFSQYTQKISLKLSYYSYYIWISQSQFNFVPIQQLLQQAGTFYIEFIYLKMSKNFSSNPCQQFGFSATYQVHDYNPMFFVLSSCVPSFVSQAFGFPSNLYANVTNIYFNNVTWRLAQTFNGVIFITYGQKQIGENQLIGDDLVNTLFIVNLRGAPMIYKLTFNLTFGQLINFRKQAQLFTAENAQYFGQIFSFWSSTGILGCFQEINTTNFILSIYPPFSQNNYENVKIVYMIGLLEQNASFQYSNNTIQGNYFIRYGDVANTTMIFQLQNQLQITADLGENQSAQMILQTSNYFSSSLQVLQLQNLDYVSPQPNPQPNPQPIDDDQIATHFGLIFGIIGGTILVILLGIFLYRYCKKKGQNDQTSSNLTNNFIELK